MFAHEGEGSESGSLSSLQLSIGDGDQDFQHLQTGTSVQRLADMFLEEKKSDMCSDHCIYKCDVKCVTKYGVSH